MASVDNPATSAEPTIVVGAGLAGLNAAWRLAESGQPVTVLEARDRVGGRTWSESLADGTVVERGGEFIAPHHDVLRGLAAELELELAPHGFPFDRRPSPGQEAPTDADLAAVATWAQSWAARPSEDVPALEALPATAEWSVVQAAALRRLETSLTVPLAKVSARAIFTGPAEGYDPADRLARGNQAVSSELARRLGDRVFLNSAVVSVRHDERGATVATADGGELRASVVILALPLPLLLELDLEPGLPDHVRNVAAKTLFGDAAKLHIPLADKPKPGGIADADSRWWCWTSQAADGGPGAAPVLSCFAGGSSAIDAIDVERALALRPDVERGDGGPLMTHWGAEPWTRGSYTAPGVGITTEDGAAWTRPWSAIVFAGEHTAGSRAGTMNGAAASGLRAAEATTALLRNRQPG